MKTLNYYPTPTDLVDTFSEEINELNGSVCFKHVTDQTLFLRATLPDCREVKMNDQIRHGVCARIDKGKLMVHPYTFREICTNGAIHVNNIASKVIEMGTTQEENARADFFFREAIRSCTNPGAFQANLDDMREAMSRGVDIAILMSSTFRIGLAPAIFDEIMDRFLGGRDHSGFGLMNAITSTARDEPDEETKWELESIGGGIIAWLKKPQARFDRDNARALPHEEIRSKSERYAETS